MAWTGMLPGSVAQRLRVNVHLRFSLSSERQNFDQRAHCEVPYQVV